MRALLPSVVAALLLVTPVAASAQSGPPRFGCKDPARRVFDFWLGRWDVTVGGQPAGTNEITLEEDGCLLHEHWTGSRGGTGQSFNWYDKATGQWHQAWVSNTGNGLQLAGTYAGNRLTLEGTAPGPGGKPQAQRLSFFRNDDGTVRQLWETSDDDGKSWQVAFDGLYRRAS